MDYRRQTADMESDKKQPVWFLFLLATSTINRQFITPQLFWCDVAGNPPGRVHTETAAGHGRISSYFCDPVRMGALPLTI